MGTRSEKVLQLRPVTCAYKDDARAITHYGLIAEEVAAVYPDLVTRTASGEVQTVKYQELIPMLLNELQREHQEVAMLREGVGRASGAHGIAPGKVSGNACRPSSKLLARPIISESGVLEHVRGSELS